MRKDNPRTSSAASGHLTPPILQEHELLRYQQEMLLINKLRFKLFMSEFLATFVFVYLGQAGVTSFELSGTQNDTINRQVAIIITYGLAFMFASLMALNLSGAHLNPAYTFASALFGRLGWGRAINYICAQYVGAFLAAIFLHATYSDKLGQRHVEGLLVGMNSTLKAHGNILSTGKLFSSYPPTEVSLTQLIISYILATAHLTFLLIAIHESKLVRIPRSLRPVYLAAGLCLILAAFSANGGPVLNPAQDFSPRLYISIFGWGSSAFNLYHYQYWWLCGLLAPHLGAILGFVLYQILSHLNEIREQVNSNSSTSNGLAGHHHHHHHDEHDEYNALSRENEPF